MATLPFFSLCLFVTLLCPFAFSADDNTCCPDSWLPYKGSCYFFHDEHPQDWTAATNWCGINKAHLAVVESQSESNFLRNFAMKLFRQADQRHHVAFWLGATDEVVEGNWVWYTNNQDLTFFDWDSTFNQPNTNFSNTEDCLALNGAYDFKWHDGKCDDKVAFALCEKKSSQDSNSGLQIIG